ncbi:MAG: amidohydrolase [Hydrotalea flava]|uniref:amidohydrolase n=1 Tax=Hydrotalea sp. AMD TaxID=2501297 RepID=UPI000942A808|nr:amidohydrolase [Hydrotalea sp. AMD]NIM35344.1 amidohydrolase [Hydrotalea flava]NIM38203.1 amidohydrolase [Hydrotalea flava]NIN03367.1 amidohydrolase [Hydrotalea flava]NIN15061.1 amidohydrolase [Hydrotalea flava]NIO94129.1 amidohydrolase [Hydrotalea flava]
MKVAKLLFLLMLPSLAFAQNETNTINTYANALNDSVIAWRRHFHQFPELSNREYNTGAYIAAYLKKLGLDVQYPVAKTGVVAILKGSKPGPVVALRADIDALPVVERIQLPFASKVTGEYEGNKVGVMHACGHDSHIAILMGTATVLTKIKNEVPGTVVFIFQPAEEGPPGNEEGGAPLMIKEGVMDHPKVDAIFGLHINSQTEIGKIKYKSGATMASSDWFTVKVKGKSSHGSQPWSGIDPIVIAAQIIQGFQTIVSRQEELTKAPVVITVGKINSGVRSNIIPETLTMEGTIRTLDSKMQKDVHERMIRTAEKIAEASGATATVSIDTKTEVTYNSPNLVKATLPALELAAGKNNVSESDWTTGAEDFSFYGDKAPAFFFFLGGMPKGMDPAKAPPHHTPDFYIDDSMLSVGVKAFCQIVFQYANTHK